MVGGQAASVGVDGEFAAQLDSSSADEIASLALLAEAEVFKGFDHGDGEGIVNHRHIDIGVGDASHGKGVGVALLGGDFDEVALSRALVGQGFADAQDPDGTLSAVSRDFGRGEENGPAPVADNAAVQQMQGRAYDAGVDHVLHGDGVAKEGVGVHGGMAAHGDRDLGQLLGGGAIEVHVTLGNHGVQADGGEAVDFLKAVGSRVEDGRSSRTGCASRAYGIAAGTGYGAVGNQGAVDAPRGDGTEGVGKVELERMRHRRWCYRQPWDTCRGSRPDPTRSYAPCWR